MLLTAVLLPGTVSAASTAGDATVNTIDSIKWQETVTDYSLTIRGESPPEYSIYELFKPLRVILDIKGADFSDSVSLPLKPESGPVVYVKGGSVAKRTPPTVRIELFLAEDSEYSVTPEQNSLFVRFPKDVPSQPLASRKETKKGRGWGMINENPELKKAIIEKRNRTIKKQILSVKKHNR